MHLYVVPAADCIFGILVIWARCHGARASEQEREGD